MAGEGQIQHPSLTASFSPLTVIAPYQPQAVYGQQWHQDLNRMQQQYTMPVNDGINNVTVNFGVVVYDLETSHDAERGNYAEKGIHECSLEEQISWKRRSQIIEFAAVDVLSGESICVRSRPDFGWEDVKSYAARMFAEDHGHADIIRDTSLPCFAEVWSREVLPFLRRAAGPSHHLAMVAHNGDAFDHFVLEKEIKRLNLPTEGGPALICFDPVKVLKHYFGANFGTGGKLALRQLHYNHVPPSRPFRAHQALDDCVMLMEVIQHWSDLNVLLACEIGAQMGLKIPGSTEVGVYQSIHMLHHRLCYPLRIHPVEKPQLQLYQRLPVEMGQGQHPSYPTMLWQGTQLMPMEHELQQMPRADPSQVVLLSTTAVNPNQAQMHMEESLMLPSPPSEALPEPKPQDHPLGRNLADLEAELHRANVDQFGKDGSRREIHENERGSRGQWKEKDKSWDQWGEWRRKNSWEREERKNWWSWEEWDQWEPKRDDKNKKKNGRRRGRGQGNMTPDARPQGSDVHEGGGAHAPPSESGKMTQDARPQGSDVHEGGRANNRRGGDGGKKGKGGYWGFDRYDGYGKGSNDWNWHWGMVPATYVPFWGKGGGRRDKWAGSGYYNQYPAETTSTNHQKSTPKPPVGKATEDLGTARWQ